MTKNYKDMSCSNHIREFSYILFIYYGILLFSFLLPYLFRLFAWIIRSDRIHVVVQNINTMDCFFLIIIASMFVSGYEILKYEKRGVVLFWVALTLNVIAKIVVLLTTEVDFLSTATMGIGITFAVDALLFGYSVWVFLILKGKFQGKFQGHIT